MSEPSVLEQRLAPHLAGFSGEVALAYYNVQSGETLMRRATTVMRSASLIKLPILVHTLTQVARNALHLDTRFPLTTGDRVGGSGLLQHLEPGLEPSLRDLLTLMIIASDNTATNKLIDLLGIDETHAFMAGLGLGGSKLVGKLQLPTAQQNPAQRRGDTNTTCAADILGLLLRLERGELLPGPLTDLALEILKRQQFTEALARYLPTDQDLHAPHVTVASKSGCLRGLWHDAGLVYSGSGPILYALVVMTENASDQSFGHEQEGMMLIARLSAEIYHYTAAAS